MALQLQLQPTVTNGVFQNPSAIRPFRNGKKVSFKAQATPTRTQRIMEGIAVSGEVGGAGGAYSYNALKRLDQLLSKICSASAVVEEPQKVVSSVPGSFKDSEHVGNSEEMFDVIVCGGTLGIFIATALSSKGLRVGVVEKNVLKGVLY